MSGDLITELVAAARARDAHILGVTGGIAAGKSFVAAALADALGWPTVSTDGWIRADAGDRKGYAESYDSDAIRAFIGAIREAGKATAPRYSHLHYDVVGHDDIVGDRVVIDGLHLGHPTLALRESIDLLVHLDAPTEVLSGWYLARFQELRTTARDDPTAMLHPYRDMDPAALDAMAMQVWDNLNAVVIESEVRPHESGADVVVRLDADHGVVEIIRR